MEIKLTLPCWYAYYTIQGSCNNITPKIHTFNKYGAESIIEDFEEFVDFVMLVDNSMWNELHAPDTWRYFDCQPRVSKEELVSRLIKCSLELYLHPEKDSWEQQEFQNSRIRYERDLEEEKIARFQYNINKALEYYCDIDRTHNWRYDPDTLDYYVMKYVNGQYTLEQALNASDQERNYRKTLGFYKD